VIARRETSLCSHRPDAALAMRSATSAPRVTRPREFWLRVLFALDIVGAGVPGSLLLVSPHVIGEWLFGGDLSPDAATSVLGSIWIALGLLSIAGLAWPVAFSPILLVQLTYKLTWLLAVALPTVATGRPVPLLAAVVSAIWVIAVAAAVPWRLLLHSGNSPPTERDESLWDAQKEESTQVEGSTDVRTDQSVLVAGSLRARKSARRSTRQQIPVTPASERNIPPHGPRRPR
jgi:hypothetical protein